MSDEATAALIAGTVSLIVALITYGAAENKIRAEAQRLEKELQRKLTDRLYDLRIKHYAQAFVITDQLGKQQGKTEEELPVLYSELVQDLRHWKSGEPSFIMSVDSLNAYYAILDALKADLALGDKYNEQQLERIWQVRTAFRKQLRNDVGLLFEEETADA